jgi:hypothetical protein
MAALNAVTSQSTRAPHGRHGLDRSAIADGLGQQRRPTMALWPTMRHGLSALVGWHIGWNLARFTRFHLSNFFIRLISKNAIKLPKFVENGIKFRKIQIKICMNPLE